MHSLSVAGPCASICALGSQGVPLPTNAGGYGSAPSSRGLAAGLSEPGPWEESPRAGVLRALQSGHQRPGLLWSPVPFQTMDPKNPLSRLSFTNLGKLLERRRISGWQQGSSQPTCCSGFGDSDRWTFMGLEAAYLLVSPGAFWAL